jgi:AcrR family transcriptional regulator
MTITPRRERIRSATVAEIKSLARRLLVSGGPPAISLRAIARDMGMTAPAIYRYFPSLDALVRDLCEDLFDELREWTEAARDACPSDEPLPRLAEMARAFRRWSVAHPAEFGLMFGNPVPGVTSFEADCMGPDHAGARFGAPFLQAFAEVWQRAQFGEAGEPNIRHFPTPPVELIEEKLGRYIAPHEVSHGSGLPVEVVYAYLSGWTRLYGLVAMEVFGHLGWAVTEVEPLFELELAAFVAQMSTTA